MACVDKIPRVAEESGLEEGEIVDDLDELSDISSEEEFLLRQRLEVLENYNNVLKRKKAKRSSVGPGTKPTKRDILCDLSEVSANELEDTRTHSTFKNIKVQRHLKPHTKQRLRKEIKQDVDENNRRKKEYRKKTTRSKKRLGVKVISETSDESEDEYRNKRRKLADAVIVHRIQGDKSSLSARLHKMIHGSEEIAPSNNIANTLGYKGTNTLINIFNNVAEESFSPVSSVNADEPILSVDVPDGLAPINEELKCNIGEPIELSTDDDVKIISNDENSENIVSSEKVDRDKDFNKDSLVQQMTGECQIQPDKDSDEDLELLRQHALKSKTSKPKSPEAHEAEPEKVLSEDEDSDTTELRMICLKSALLKKAIEMKQKQKLQKKLSQSSNLEEDLFNDQILYANKIESENNTDIESVDMDIGSDADEKHKDGEGNQKINIVEQKLLNNDNDNNNSAMTNAASKDEELDEDEDLLRAKLLTSLSKNLPNLVSPEILNKKYEVKNVSSKNVVPTVNKTVKVPEVKKFIIKLDESDSEGEHEATKNLTKMHMKLSEQIDFQQKLDLFLKSTRMEVEKTKLPDVVQKPPQPKKPEKYVAKAVNHLPKSEQIEYKNLVRRMAELEKMKQSRQAAINLVNQTLPVKDTLKPRNVTIDTVALNNNLEEQIAKSRKKIAEESSKMLNLKEEATKLSQRYKIAATELRNITTAITLNKKQQKAIQNNLTKIRLQHQSLLKSSTTSIHSKVNGSLQHMLSTNKVLSNKLQKENYPKDEYNNPQVQKTVKISVVNDFKADVDPNPVQLSVQIDIANNKKVVKTSPVKDRVVEVNEPTVIRETERIDDQQIPSLEDNKDQRLHEVKAGGRQIDNPELETVCDQGNKRHYISSDDYKSPLDALGNSTWQADPNAVLCPFEVGGQCKDPDCKYLHTTPPGQ